MNLHGRSLLERALLGIAALAAAVLLFFFLAAALALGAILVVTVLARLWWLKRGLKRTGQAETLNAEYTVVERERPVQPRLPDDTRAGPAQDR